MKNYPLFILFILISNNAFCYEFSGFIYDKTSSEPLTGVSVRIERSGFGALTDKKGIFSIKNIPAGNHTAIINLIGFKPLKIDLIFPRDQSKNHEFALEEKQINKEEIIVSANKRVQNVQEVPVAVSTISLKELTDRNINDIDKALEYVPGVNITGGQVSIRGSSGFAFGLGSRVAFLLNGFPLLSGDQGDIKFDIIPIFNIARMEIVKGAGSALYGTGALGGVVNIITESPKDRGEVKLKTFSGFYTT